eukprot:SAG31_NODE_10177_length_1175_cov_0.895911_3_plen_44_part_01
MTWTHLHPKCQPLQLRSALFLRAAESLSPNGRDLRDAQILSCGF